MPTEISEKTKKGIQELILLGKGKDTRKPTARGKRKSQSITLLKSLGVYHKSDCYECQLNCEVKHMEDSEFWAKGTPPIYYRRRREGSLEADTNCPKEGHLAREEMKEQRRIRRKGRRR